MHQTEKLFDRTSGETIRVRQTKHVHITLCGRTNRQWYYNMHQTEKLLDRTSGETIRVGQTKHVHITLCGRTNRQWYYDMHQTEKLFDRTSGGCQIAISYCVNLAYNIEKEDQSHHHLYH
jgi:hypothetical protein